MKRSALLAFFFLALFSPISVFAQSKAGYPMQCVDDANNPTRAWWLTCTQARAGTSRTNPLYVAPTGTSGHELSDQYVWDGAAWVQQRAGVINADNIVTTLTLPYSMSFLVGFDGTNFDRVRLSTLDATFATTQIALNVQSNGYFYNGATFARWPGEAWDAAMTAAPVVPSVNALGVFYDGNAGHQVVGSLAGADGVSNSTAMPWGSSWSYAYNGTTWDRIRVNAAAGNAVQTVDLLAPNGKIDDDDTSQCVAITAGSVQYTLPQAGWYMLNAIDNNAYLNCASNPTATTSVGGFTLVVPDAAPMLVRLTGPKCAVIGKAAQGTICFLDLTAASGG